MSQHAALVLVAKRALKTKLFEIAVGQPFRQDKHHIRGLGLAYNVPDAATKPFAALDYVRVAYVDPTVAPPGCPVIRLPEGARIEPPPWRRRRAEEE